MPCRTTGAVVVGCFMLAGCLSGWAQKPARDARVIFEQGQRALENQQYAVAEKDFKRVIELQADSAPAYANLGTVYLRTNRTDAAIGTLKHAEKLAPNVAAIRLDLGLAYFKKHEFKRAASEFSYVISADPGSLQAHYLKGTCDFMTDDFKPAIAALEPIFPREQDDLEYLYMLGVSYGMLKQANNANKIFEQLVEAGNNTPHLHLLLGKAYLALGDSDKAEAELKHATSGEPLPFAHYYLGVLYQKTGQFEQAAGEFEKEIAIAPDNAWAYKNLSDLELDRGDTADAILLLKKGSERNPDAPELFANLGRACLQTGDLAHSIAALKRAIALDSENSSYHLQLGRALLKAGRTHAANAEIARGQALASEVPASQMQALSRDQAGDASPTRSPK